MARQRKQIGSVGSYKRYTTWKDGDYISGKFVEQGIDDKYKKPFFVIEIEDFSFANPLCSLSKKKEKEGLVGKEVVEGMKLTLNSAGGLDWRMKDVQIGDVVEVVYKGTEELPEDHIYGGKDSHQFEVYVLGDEEEEENETEGL